MALKPTYTIVNSAGVGQGTVDLLVGLASEAFRLWGEALAGNANLSVRIEILEDVESGRADGGWGNGTNVGIGKGGYSLGVGAPAYELMTGKNVTPLGGDADIVIRFDVDYLLDELYLDPTPKSRGGTPSDKTDGLSVMIHEIGHALGFTGYWNEAGNSFQDNFNTPYDQRLVLVGGEAKFAGPNAKAVYGAAVPLTNNKYQHYGNNPADPTTSDDPLTGLMNGVFFYPGYHYTIGDLDLAMLADMGLGTIRDDILNAPGHVYLRGGRGNDTVTGSAIDNVLFGDAGNDVVSGLGGKDELFGGGGADKLLGGGGNDELYGNDGADELLGGAGDDLIFGNAGIDLLVGGAGIDQLFGGSEGDELIGGGGADTLAGGGGADLLRGGLGADKLAGGAGADKFRFDTAPGSGNVDRIADFSRGSDKILLENAVFASLPAGALAPGAIAIGTAAKDAGDRIIYDPSSGALLYDRDGTGAAAAVRFAVLDNSPATLAASDFTVI